MITQNVKTPGGSTKVAYPFAVEPNTPQKPLVFTVAVGKAIKDHVTHSHVETDMMHRSLLKALVIGACMAPITSWAFGSLDMQVWVPELNDHGYEIYGHWEQTSEIKPYSKMRITAKVQPKAEHQGSPGLVYILAEQVDTGYASFSDGKWNTYSGGRVIPTVISADGLKANYTIPLYDGTVLCSTLGDGEYNLYAAYGILSPQDLAKVKTMLKAGLKHDENYVKGAFAENEARVNKRYIKLGGFSCSSSISDGGH